MMIMSSISEEISLYDFGRSTKGASKQRRDQINAEIGVMRDLLPLPESARLRLSQLQIMSLSCVYIRKCQLLEKLFGTSPYNVNTPFDFFQSLTSFLLVTTKEGKLVYISENVTEYLGHSMVDMKTQGDSIYDIIDKRDHANVQAQLQHGGSSSSKPDQDITFFCRMNMSRCLKRQTGPGDIKIMHVKGHFASTLAGDASGEKSVFLGLCSPLITPDIKENLIQNNTLIFKSVHSLDMRFLELTENGEHYLGLSNDAIFRKSWYTMLHPEDLIEAREKHVQLIRSRHEMGCMMTVRMITDTGDLLWVNIVMHVRQGLVPGSNDPVIVCVNQVLSEEEAYHFKVQSQVYSVQSNRSPDFYCHSGYPGSASPGMERDVYMQPYQLPGYYPTNVMNYQPQPYGRFPAQDPVSTNFTYNQAGVGIACGAPVEKREDCGRKAGHAQAVEALKRKLEENTPCRVRKLAGMNVNQNGGYPPGAGHFGCVTNGIAGSNQGYSMDGISQNYGISTQAYSYGPSQVMTAPMNGHIPDLCFSLKSKSPEAISLAPELKITPGLPPTPDPSPIMTTATTTIPPSMIKTEDLSDWYLTPEASPGSPSPVTEEHVTAFARKLEEKIKAELTQACQLESQPAPILAISPAKRRKLNRDLPVMDGSAVDDFFDSVIGDQLDVCSPPPTSQVKSEKVPKREIPIMDTMDIESFFKQTVPISLMCERNDVHTKVADVQIVPDQSTPSPHYNPASVESGDFLMDGMVSGPGSVDADRVTMTVSVAVSNSLPENPSTSLSFEENDELFNQLLSWATTSDAHPSPDPNQ